VLNHFREEVVRRVVVPTTSKGIPRLDWLGGEYSPSRFWYLERPCTILAR
jgi:hypothetical protein